MNLTTLNILSFSIILTVLDLVFSYWDSYSCGPDGNDANWEWCRRKEGICNDTISTSKCPSGTATLKEFQRNLGLHGCHYHYRAVYFCTGI